MAQPVMVILGGLSNTIYAVRRYKERGNGLFEVVGSAKDDVTQQAIRATFQHIQAGCVLPDCDCQFLVLRTQCGKIFPVPAPGEVVRACMWAPRHNGPHSDGEIDWAYSPPPERDS